MVYLTRRLRFNAAHKLWVDGWSAEENLATFGKCSNPNWHGHNYELFVTVKGDPDPVTGFVMDAKKLKDLVTEHVIEKVDHRNINVDTDLLPAGAQPTTENVVLAFWNILQPLITDCELHCLRLHETENIYVEYYG